LATTEDINLAIDILVDDLLYRWLEERFRDFGEASVRYPEAAIGADRRVGSRGL